MHPFTDYIYRKLVDEMRSWEPKIAHDLYAVALWIFFNDDDPRQFEVCWNYNTTQNWQDRINDAWDSNEAKWNSAFWLQPDGFRICGRLPLTFNSTYVPSYADRRGLELRHDFLKTLNFPYDWTDEEQKILLKGPDYTDFRQYLTALIRSFVDICVEVAQRMHKNGDIIDVCGRSMPIVIKIMNDMDNSYAKAQTLNANPDGLANECIRLAP